SRRLNFSLNQSDGPAAHRSYRYEDHHIYGFLAQLADDGRNTLGEQALRLAGIADKGIMRLRGASDVAAGFQFNQSRQRNATADVLLNEVGIDVQMVDANILCPRVPWDDSERRVAEPRIPAFDFLIERLVRRERDRGRAD